MPESPEPRADVAPASQGEALPPEAPAPEDRHLRRSLGYWQLTAIGFSGVIGSGWLLASMVAAQIARPEAIVAWLVGGAVLALIALVMADLGAARPESGGLVRWPFYSNGRLVATIAGWGIWISYATNPPSESAATLEYMSKYVPQVYNGSSLTTLGVLLGAIATAGIIYAYTGFQGPVDLSGEARNPRRDVPRAVLTSLALSAGLYLLLQVVFVGAAVYAYQQWRGGVDWQDVRLGAWLVGYLIAIGILSALGSKDFGGSGLIPAPYDSVIAAVVGLVAYLRGVRDGLRHLAAHPTPEPLATQEPPARPER